MNAALKRIENRPSRIVITAFAERYLEDAMQVAREIHAASLYRAFPLDEAKLANQLQGASNLASDRYFRLAVRADRVLGGFYGCVHRVFFCDELMAKDLGWWVREDARGSAAAVRLLADFERWARGKGARKVGLGQTGVGDFQRTAKLFRHCGYQFTGYNVAKDL